MGGLLPPGSGMGKLVHSEVSGWWTQRQLLKCQVAPSVLSRNPCLLGNLRKGSRIV